MRTENGVEVDLEDGLRLAIQAGVDWNLSKPWTLNLDARKVWFDTDARINDGALTSRVALDPWSVSPGVGHKF